MSFMSSLPKTPDFDHWPVTHALKGAEPRGASVRVTWDDGKACDYHAFFLRENSPDEATLHPLSRESIMSPLDLPDDLRCDEAVVDDTGALVVTWSHGGHVSRYHPGWLRAHGWFGEEQASPQHTLWTAADLPAPPSFDGPTALQDDDVFLAWLEALQIYGVARLEGLANKDGLLEEVVQRIGPVRESNFGRSYTLEIKDDPDSNAFTSAPLLQHMDMPTRECPHGLQFLFCRKNTARGGEGLYCDGYRIAEDMRREEPDHFRSLTEDLWEHNNRAKASSYRAKGPVIETDRAGAVSGLRITSWLRAPMKAPLEVQERAYKAVRAFMARAQDARYLLRVTYRPGDLFAFDNRRALHGRAGYDASGGERFIEGIYADRDDLYSRIRTLKRARAATGEQ